MLRLQNTDTGKKNREGGDVDGRWLPGFNHFGNRLNIPRTCFSHSRCCRVRALSRKNCPTIVYLHVRPFHAISSLLLVAR